MHRSIPKRSLLLAVLASLALVPALATGSGGPAARPAVSIPLQSEGCATATPLAPGDHLLQVDVEGVDREALIHVPPGRTRPLPLLLAFHGAGSSGPGMAPYSGLSKLADEQGFAVAYPSADAPRHVWILAATPGAVEQRGDDVSFTRRLLDDVKGSLCVDARRVSAVGVSNGGGFVARLGCELSDKLAAIVVVAGGFSTVAACTPARPLSVLEIHGTDDPVVPYGGRAGAGAVPQWLADWRSRDGCAAKPWLGKAAVRVVRFIWGPCRAGVVVEHLRISGGKHQWPGANPADPGPASTISAATEAWRFIQPRHLTPASTAKPAQLLAPLRVASRAGR